ncbi:hypothetical protein DY000_02042029 [Brassica cretica]|uniref:Uncharacterized protein n=1 Tax=Brassica cretica TaxID=69181 RepID=A0ABQ7BA35_BRACR|nr:hypothetical protein DY000_02042029 [Brassica cretica]
MPNSTRSNKETQLLFSPDPASLERSIRKEARSSSIDNNARSSLDPRQPPSTQALVPSTDTPSPPSTDTRSPPSTDTRSPPSTEDTHLPSTDILHPTSIDTSIRTSIDTEPRDMVATLILVRDEKGDLYDQEGHLRNATEVIQNRSTSYPGHRSRTPTESTASCNAVRIITHEEFAAKHPHPPIHVYVKIDGHSDPVFDRHQEKTIDQQPPAPIDRRAPITYRVQMPKIDVARLNALWPKPKPSENPPEAVRTPSEDETDSMEVDRVPTGRTLRRRKEKVAKHLKMGVNEKENESF